MRFLTKVALLGGVAYAAKWAYDNKISARQADNGTSVSGAGDRVRVGYDTPTGTDPNAKYSQPGYEGKSFGQAVGQDQELVDRLVEERGDGDGAEQAFRAESAGAPALDRQERTNE